MKFNIMKSLLSLGLTLFCLYGFAQLQNQSVNSLGGDVASGGNYESIIIVGDPGASTEIGIAGSQELYLGFIAGNFLGNQAINDFVDPQDSLALVAFYNNAGGANWTNSTGWLTDPVKDWFGVGVDGDRVVNLSLQNNNLTGFVTDSVSGLTSLVNLNLSNNQLTRDIPDGLGSMQNLRFVDLSNNQLNGFIPDSLGSLAGLTSLNVSSNRLTGVFKEAITNMVSLTELDLSDNDLLGTLPANLGELVSMQQFDISGNQFEGELADLSNWTQLRFFDVSGNELNGMLDFLAFSDSLSQVNIRGNSFDNLPDLSGRTFDLIDVSRNQLDFGDLEPNVNLQNFTFAPQDSIGMESDTVVQQGAVVELGFTIEGDFNFYQWELNGTDIDGATFQNYTVAGATNADDGTYVLKIGNDLFPDFFLYTQPFELVVSSLQRDQQALEEIYSKTGGGSVWSAENWTEGSLADTEWEGVILNDDGTAVTALVLPDKGLSGPMPRDIRFMANLDSVDLSNNNLTRFPDISRYELSYLNLSENKLAFGSLIPNKEAVVSASDFIYSPQKEFGFQRDSVAQAGDDILITSSVPGSFNDYSWFFDDFANLDENIISLDESVPFYTIDDINYDRMGKYFVEVTNDELPDLTITAAPWRVLAKDDIFGTVFSNDQGELLTDGRVDLFRITREGPYDSTAFTSINTEGRYILRDIILGDFILKVDPGDGFDEVLQTYFEQQDDWVNADTLRLRQKTTGIDIFMVFNPGDFDPGLGGTGTIGGELFSDFDESSESGSRIEARRRVKKAGCSLRRRVTGGGRTDQDDEYELVAYVESDENGNFSFNNIPDGEYRLNIQYPGVPMDESTAIDFVIGGGGTMENEVFTLDAVITEEGIQVQVIEALGDLKPFIKNVLLYPNPTEGVLRFDYLVYRKMNDLKVTIMDTRGVQLLEKQLDHSMGRHGTEIDMTDLESGVYLLTLSNGDQSFSFRKRIIRE